MNDPKKFVYAVFDQNGRLIDIWATEQGARQQMQDFDFAFVRALQVKDE